MELLDDNIRKDVVKKYGQYTKRVNGQMIKGESKFSEKKPKLHSLLRF